jgi:uncharacterized protein (TIGR02145 family)
MKNLSFIIISIIALTTFSCQREDVQKNGELITITATQQGLPDLKTNIGAPGTYGVTWNATDNLAVFDGTGLNKNVPFNYSSGAGTQSGNFSGTITGWTSGSKTFYGVYPYNIANSTSHSPYGLTIPTAQTQDFSSGATQYAHLGLYDFMAAAPVTVTKSGADQPTIDFNFQHLMAILDIEVTNSTGGAVTVTKISIKRAGNDFAATANLDLSKDPGSNYASATKTNQLDLTITNAVSTGSGEKFTGSMIVAPVDLSGANSTNFVITVSGGAEYTVTKTSGPVLAAGKRYKVLITISSPDLTDSRDSKVYKTVKIGNQTWMAENLAYLPAVFPYYDSSESLLRYYVNSYDGYVVDQAMANPNYSIYGVLYNWPAALAACPSGWHLPTDAEWTTLTDYLTNNGYGYGGSGIDIGKSMASTSGWEPSPTAGTVGNNQGSNNSSGFTALSCGIRYSGGYSGPGSYSYFWSATGVDPSSAVSRVLEFGANGLNQPEPNRAYGFSVRCLQGN